MHLLLKKLKVTVKIDFCKTKMSEILYFVVLLMLYFLFLYYLKIYSGGGIGEILQGGAKNTQVSLALVVYDK